MQMVHQGTRVLAVPPKLVRVPNPTPKHRFRDELVSQIMSHWKKIGSAGVFGIGFGFVVAAVGSPTIDKNLALRPHVQHAVTRPAALKKDLPLTNDPDAVLKLQARNRRLEALVEVLRTRAKGVNPLQDHSHSQDAGSELGQ